MTDSSKLSDDRIYPPSMSCNHPDEEARNLMVSWRLGLLISRVDNLKTHCLSYMECCSTLAIILRLACSTVGEEEEKVLAPVALKT